MLLTAYTIKTRYPRAQTLGEYREELGDVLSVWKREIEWIFRWRIGDISISSSEYRKIDELKRYPEG